MLDIDLSKAKKAVIEADAKTVLVQLPEGLKQFTTQIAEELKVNNNEVFVVMDPTFGACDLALHQMKSLNADLLIHLGHAPIHRPKNVVHIPIYDTVDGKTFEKLMKEVEVELKKKKFKAVALCTHAQFLPLLDKIKNRLEEKNFKVLIGEGSPRIAERGQVLGCNYTAVTSIEHSADAILYFGEGLFHPIGIAFSSKKPVLFADTSTAKVVDLSKERDLYARKRFAAIAMAKEAESFGILISTKTGQRYKQVALDCKALIEGHGKKAFLLAMDLVREEYMAGVKVDCFVNTACTRIVGDDAEHWKKPIINPLELEIVFGKRKWEDFNFDVLY
ncbi:MAG: diphthamide biosynthesis enzyme Dph2 [Candidatus Diapherotrites archaeon]|uniref:2-(3-amino-3-carboxypropyl)histidine synthase n=1 Tax=Candidatus Iainarchaeum sp. TaxID=3101447 RepID=A0A7J4ITJ2_9ARCH|nr:MAG: diphthamide synthase subunit DPH2 [archaeon GW2011_AR10]MBS3059127.1 diphthamide biosynthesis enzyme Dph2 [Candidatus Diapherotrites archaeon]HIH08084.1 diphthamide biosynthesis enzyme Dph2 [Candidatus Diapherotrites archaeon]